MAVYLWANAVLYLVFAVWITVSPWATAAGLGYETLSRSGRSEYLVVYGGLQLGLAAFFAFTALSAQTQRFGIIFALCLYGPIVLYRAVTVVRIWPVQSTTLWVAGLEAGLLLLAIGLFVYCYCAGRNP